LDASRPAPLNASVPAFTFVDPLYVFAPLKLNVPLLAFTNEPAANPSATTPPNAPPPTVNAVPFKVTPPVPPPFNAAKVTARGDSTTEPSADSVTAPTSPAPVATVSCAPAATATSSEAKRADPLSAKIPAFTVVDPVKVFTPLNVNAPLLTFTNEPAADPSAITPPNIPLLNVNAVPPNTARPVTPPSNVSNSAAVADSVNVPSNVKAALVDNAAPDSTETSAPAATVIAADVNRAVPLNANVPASTAVAPV
jgi:hypothetical protein